MDAPLGEDRGQTPENHPRDYSPTEVTASPARSNSFDNSKKEPHGCDRNYNLGGTARRSGRAQRWTIAVHDSIVI